MRPDRIIIGEVRGSETLDMLQAMNTGHEGSMTTVHANNPRDALTRLENMVSMAGLNFPIQVIRQQMVSGLHLVIHLNRLTGGRRKIVCIAEITGMEGQTVCLQDLFEFHQTGIGPDGHAQGRFECNGIGPRVLDHIKAEGVDLPRDLFRRRVLNPSSPSA
jgi:pilus assembly protein CpaF